MLSCVLKLLRWQGIRYY